MSDIYNVYQDDWLGWVDTEEVEMKMYSADFETTTDIDDCRVWAWAVCDIDDIDDIAHGNDMISFLEYCESLCNCKMYFHNLGFDGAFIIDHLERAGWIWTDERVSWHSYKTLISDMNQVYAIELYFSEKRYVKIYDSFKIIPLSVKNMAKAYNLPIQKGSIDYEAKREIGHQLTDEEIEYIDGDVKITAYVLSQFFAQGLTRITAGSNALQDYKNMCGGHKNFRYAYPVLSDEEDEFIRAAYRGGFTYVKPDRVGKRVGNGMVFDVNSLYPSVMASCDGEILPLGNPLWFDGEPEKDDSRPLWIASITCEFELKPEHIPSLQIKSNWRFKPTEYLESSNGIVNVILTNVDWELMNEQYDILFHEFNGGYSFQASPDQFKEYVSKWTAVKVDAGKMGNSGLRQIAKLMLNSLYGKFATRTKVVSRKPVMDDDVVRYVDMEPENRDPVYLPVGVFVTAYARRKTIRAAQSVYDRFVYADTDSLHILGDELPDVLEVDDYELGKWAHENDFEDGKFLGAKCYAELVDGELVVHVSGMPSRCHSGVTLDNFEIGARYYGKLYPRRVHGGIVLVEDYMEIRERR